MPEKKHCKGTEGKHPRSLMACADGRGGGMTSPLCSFTSNFLSAHICNQSKMGHCYVPTKRRFSREFP